MALLKEHTVIAFGQELIFPNAYHQITNVNGNKNALTIILSIFSYENDLIGNLIEDEIYTFTPSVATGSANFIAQGYDFLKTLPNYASAVDKLEEGQAI